MDRSSRGTTTVGGDDHDDDHVDEHNNHDGDNSFVDDYLFPGGISGPRRSTAADTLMMQRTTSEINAANAEATRLAQEMGIVSTTTTSGSNNNSNNVRSLSFNLVGTGDGSIAGKQQQPPPQRQQSSSSSLFGKRTSGGGLFSRNKSLLSSTLITGEEEGVEDVMDDTKDRHSSSRKGWRRRSIQQQRPSQTTTKDDGYDTQQQQQHQESLDYQVLPPDGRAMGVGLLRTSTAASVTAAATAVRVTTPASRQSSLFEAREVQYVGMSPLSGDGLMKVDGSGSFPMQYHHHHDGTDENDHDVDTPIGLFDSTGMRAPYRQGPYDYHHDEDGRLIKKRWYGRMEDGYLAWSSIYLHEYLGFTIYTPLTEQQEEDMKNKKYLPDWIENLSSLPNLAIPLSYFCIGVALQLLRTPLIVYFIVDKNASAAEVNVLFTIMAVPWCFKVIYGFLSDCLPISGLRRKPYFMTGWLVYIVSNFILMVHPSPSIGMCISLVFVQTAGYMLADVMTDALIVERSRFETEEKRGSMQSRGYIVRFFGSTVGAIVGAVVYNRDEWDFYLPIRLIFFLNGALPLVVLLPVVPYLLELDNHCAPKNFGRQCRELFETVQLRAVWQPMTFVYVYNALQLTNAAWMNFLVEGLDFTAWMIGIVGIMGSITAWFGIMTYERFFFATNWRIVYFWCTALASIIALGQLILVFGLNTKMGIPDILFSAGDDLLVEFIIAIQFLPMCIMYLGLCPPGSEGTTYALLTTWSNLAGSLAFDISTALTMVWDVSSQTISEGDYTGVWKLSLLCGLIGPLPLVLLGLIPKSKEDQRSLQQDTTKHYWAGVIFLVVMVLTLVITFVESTYEVYFNKDQGGMADGGGDEVPARRALKRMIGGH